jgi:hypothetical protein
MERQTVATLIREGSKLLSHFLQSFAGQRAVPSVPSEPIEPKQESKGPTTDETIRYQKKEIVKQLVLLEGHLQQSCKIEGKACDCCTKHPITIEGLAEEAAGMAPDPIFREIAAWAKSIGSITTQEASASGEYDGKYPELAIKAREYRKALMPNEKEV